MAAKYKILEGGNNLFRLQQNCLVGGGGKDFKEIKIFVEAAKNWSHIKATTTNSKK